MRTEEELTQQVIQAISSALSVDGKTIQPQTRLIKDLGIESIDMVDIAYELEQILSTEVDFADVLRFAREKAKDRDYELKVQDIVDFLKSRTA